MKTVELPKGAIMMNEVDYTKRVKEKMVDRLRQDCETLLTVKIPKALENISDDKGVNTYRNLTRALADNIKLIEEYDYQLMYSEYTDMTDENKPVKQVAVWEQNGDCDIRNHKVWNVKDAINSSGVVADTITINGNLDESTIDNISKLLKDKLPKIIEDTISKKDISDKHSCFSRYFNNKLRLTPIQKQLIELKNTYYDCLRGEGSTFGVLLSAIHQASSKDDMNIMIATHLNNYIGLINNELKIIMDEYINVNNNKIANIDSNLNGNSNAIKIDFKNGSKIVIASMSNGKGLVYKPDLLYLSNPIQNYQGDTLEDFTKSVYLDNQDKMIWFSTFEDGSKYYDIKTREIKDLV